MIEINNFIHGHHEWVRNGSYKNLTDQKCLKSDWKMEKSFEFPTVLVDTVTLFVNLVTFFCWDNFMYFLNFYPECNLQVIETKQVNLKVLFSNLKFSCWNFEPFFFYSSFKMTFSFFLFEMLGFFAILCFDFFRASLKLKFFFSRMYHQ